MDTQVDSFTIPSVLKDCRQSSFAVLGKETHSFVLKSGLDGDVFVCNALIQMYSESGNVVLARLLFDKMTDRDVVSWSTMIRSCVRNILFGEALELIREMHRVRVRPSEIAMISMVNLFAGVADIEMGKAMHVHVVRNGKHEKLGVPVTSALIDMYVKCGNLTYARRLFDGLGQKNIVSWTAMIAGYIHCRDLHEVAKLFNRMLAEGLCIFEPSGELVRALGGAVASTSLLGVPLGHNSSFLQGPTFAPPRIREAIWCGSTNSTTEEVSRRLAALLVF
ncbi:hypothetical protein EV1_014101 [Malus domestica]